MYKLEPSSNILTAARLEIIAPETRGASFFFDSSSAEMISENAN